MRPFNLNPNDFLGIKDTAATFGCSRGKVYDLIHQDPDFQPDAYIGRSPKFLRSTVERKRRKLIQQRHPGKRGPGRPAKNALRPTAE